VSKNSSNAAQIQGFFQKISISQELNLVEVNKMITDILMNSV